MPVPSPARVLVDVTAVPARRAGVGRYVDSVLPAVAEQGQRLAVVCRPEDEAHYAGLLPSAHVVAGPAALGRRPVRLAWEQVGLPRVARQVGADVLHCPHYTMPVRPGLPTVVTLHDATFFSDPVWHSPVKARFFRTATRWSLAHAAACLVVSRASRDELVRHAGADPGRLVVASLGVDRGVFRPPTADEVAAVRAYLGLGPSEPWVAFLGTLEPRKNVPALVAGWTRASDARADPPALVLAGPDGWDTEVPAALAAVPAGRHLVRAGYLPVELLAAYLGGSQVVAYPSRGEGFGLPVLEAMACGAAVLTSSVGPLVEIGGDAVARTGLAAHDIAAALTGLLDAPDRRRELGTAALQQAARFTWQDCAAAHVEAYARAAASRAAA